MDHVSSLRKVLYEGIQEPHQVIRHQVKPTALPVDQHGGEGVLLPLALLEHEVVQLGISMHQSIQTFQRVIVFQINENFEEEFVEFCQNLKFRILVYKYKYDSKIIGRRNTTQVVRFEGPNHNIP